MLSTLRRDLVLLCTLESVSPVLFPALMLTQETFSILPQEHRGKLLSSGLKVSSLYSFSSSVSSYDWWGGHQYTTPLGERSLVTRISYSKLFQYYKFIDDCNLPVPLIESQSPALISMVYFFVQDGEKNIFLSHFSRIAKNHYPQIFQCVILLGYSVFSEQTFNSLERFCVQALL